MRNAVHPNPDLRAVSTYEDNIIDDDPTKAYSYDKYLERLRNAAEGYDSALQRSGGKVAARKVYTHEIDDPVTEVFAHARINNNGQTRMDTATWKRISPAGKLTWDTLSEEDKAIILSIHNEPTTSAQSAKFVPKPLGNRSRDRRQVAAVRGADSAGLPPRRTRGGL